VPRKSLSFREVKRRIEAAGFVAVGQEGSHVTFAKMIDGVTHPAIVAHHREVSVGTLASILRQAGLNPDESDRF
jgi:predicted RNA binding protein YcfA (HicA-like mRNA interferase family)